MTDAALQERVQSLSELLELVHMAKKILPSGARTKPALSRAADGTLAVDLRGLSGIVEYKPAEYTITALAGTPVHELDGALRANRQYLPFDPVLVQSGATAGGTVASGVSGSGRLRYGGIRDFILGTRFVDGMGVLHRGGGKVVKNAAGFDFPKLLAGSLGRLGILVDVTFKVFPRPAAYATLVTPYASLSGALKAMSTLAVSPVEVMAMDLVAERGGYSLATRIGGDAGLLDARTERLAGLLPASTIVTGEEETQQWADVTEFAWADAGAALVKVPLTPSRIPEMESALAAAGQPRRYTVAGNVLWLAWHGDLGDLHNVLDQHSLSGVVLRGEAQAPLIGARRETAFATRIRAALDPVAKFQPTYPE